jgi:hypothetical protein
MKKREEKTGNIQEQFILLQEVRGPVLCLALPTGGVAYRSVIEISGTHLTLLDEAKQQDIHELYHRLFLGLDFPIEIIVQIRPLDLEAYLQYVDMPGPKPWQALAADHAAFLRALAKRQPLLGRRFFLVVPAEEEFSTTQALPGWGRKKKQAQLSQELSMEQAALTLRARYETISYHLQSIGASCRLLTNKKLTAFYRNFFLNKPPLLVKIERDHIKLDDHYIRVQTIDHLPRLVGFGWLKPLIECSETIDIIHHLIPRSPVDALAFLRRQQTHAQASLMFATQSGRSTPAIASIANSDLGPLVEDVTSGEQTMIDSELHVLIRASSFEELEQRTRRVMNRINTTFTHHPRTCYFDQARAFRSCTPGMMAGYDPLLIPSHAAASMLPFFDHFIFQPASTAILEGVTPHNEPIVLDWWAGLPNANRLIVGPSGWGKSYKAKLDILHLYYVYKALAIRQHKQEDGFQIIIVDPERETTRSQGFNLIERLGGQSIRFSPGSAHRLNPLDLPPVTASPSSGLDTKEDILANHIQQQHKIFDLMLAHNVEDKSSTLTPQEKSLLDAVLYECYREAGIFSDRATHSRPAPLLRDLYRILSSETCGPDSTGLAQRLRRYTEGSLSGLFSGATNINLENTVIQFDVKELDSELRPVALMMISNFIWNVSFNSSIFRFLFIDELATIGRYRAGQNFLEEIFQRARKHGLSVCGMTQQAGHLTKSIIANCAVHVLLHQDDTTIDYVTDLFKLSGREAQRVRGFDKGEALLLINGKRMMVKFTASPMEDKLITTNRKQIAALEAGSAQSS